MSAGTSLDVGSTEVLDHVLPDALYSWPPSTIHRVSVDESHSKVADAETGMRFTSSPLESSMRSTVCEVPDDVTSFAE